MKRLLCVALIGLGLVAGILPAQAKSGAIIASYGNWNVRRTVEVMTDRIQCLATYKGNLGIQLYSNALYLKFSKSPREYWYRIDDQPISQMIRASEAVWRARLITFSGEVFNQIVKARRLRLQVFALHDFRELDLDLDGIYSAYGAVYHCR